MDKSSFLTHSVGFIFGVFVIGFNLHYFVFKFFCFVVLGLVSSVPSQNIDHEEHVWNDLFFVTSSLLAATNRLNFLAYLTGVK